MEKKDTTWYKNHLERQRENYKSVEKFTGHCKECGIMFTGTRAKEFCSDGCRLKNWRANRCQ